MSLPISELLHKYLAAQEAESVATERRKEIQENLKCAIVAQLGVFPNSGVLVGKKLVKPGSYEWAELDVTLLPEVDPLLKIQRESDVQLAID